MEELPLTANHRKPRVQCRRCRLVGPIVGRGLCGKCWHAAKAAGQLNEWPKVPRCGEREARPTPTPPPVPTPAPEAQTVTLVLPPEGVALWAALEAEARRQWRTPEGQLCAMLAAHEVGP